MSLNISKRTRLARLEAARASERTRGLAERLAEARLFATGKPQTPAAELIERYRQLGNAPFQSAITARLLRAAIRAKAYEDVR